MRSSACWFPTSTREEDETLHAGEITLYRRLSDCYVSPPDVSIFKRQLILRFQALLLRIPRNMTSQKLDAGVQKQVKCLKLKYIALPPLSLHRHSCLKVLEWFSKLLCFLVTAAKSSAVQLGHSLLFQFLIYTR